MQKTKKPSAAERTVDMFSQPQLDKSAVQAAEVILEAEKADRVPMEQDADRLRQGAFTGQEWTTAAFGAPEAESDQYRMSLKGNYYYLEHLSYEPGKPGARAYTGVMIHEKNLYAAATVIAAAARAKKASETK